MSDLLANLIAAARKHKWSAVDDALQALDHAGGLVGVLEHIAADCHHPPGEACCAERTIDRALTALGVPHE